MLETLSPIRREPFGVLGFCHSCLVQISSFGFRASGGAVTAALASRYLPLAISLAAIALSLPALRAGLLNDDFMHQAILAGPGDAVDRLSEKGLVQDGSGRLRHALSHLFVAVHPEQNLHPLRDYGALPWWTYDGFRVAFWRPAASLTHWLDYRLFPRSLALMHLHNILWFAAAMMAIAVLYRQIASIGHAESNDLSAGGTPYWIGGLAALMYLLDDNSFFPTLWIANRNLLISVFFGALTVIAYDRRRRQGWRPGAVVAPMCLLAAVLATEGGVAIFAYLFAYEIALGGGRMLRRGFSLAPSVAVIVLWRLVYNWAGYGASGGGFYFDPVREPFNYMGAVLLRGPFFLGGQWSSIPSDLYSFLPPANRTLLWVLLAAFTILIPAAVFPMLRTSRRARFWLIGMYAAALPVCATVPMSRALLFIGIGAFGFVADYLGGWLTKDSWVPTHGWKRHALGTLFVVLFIVHVPLAGAGRLGAASVTARLHRKMAQTLDLTPAGTSEDRDLIVVNAPNPIAFLYEPYQRASEGRPLPRGIHILAPGFNAVEVTRTAERRLTIRSLADSLLDCQRGKRMDFVFFYRYLADVRSSRHPLKAEDRIALPRMQVEVLAVDGRGFPVEAAFEFDVPLEDRSLNWLLWDWNRKVYRTMTLPAVGQSMRLVGPF
jgi:hypothetical protein